MSLAFDYDVSLGYVPADAVNNPATSEVIIAGSLNNSVTRYILSTGAANGVVNPIAGLKVGIALLSSTIGFVTTTSLTSIPFFDLTALTATDIPVGTAARAFSSTKGQQAAGNTSTGFGLATSSQLGTMVQVNVSLTASAIVCDFLSGCNASAIINKAGSNNFLVGTTRGGIYEVTSAGAAIIGYFVPPINTFIDSVNPPSANVITGLSYSDGLVLAMTSTGFLHLFEHASGALLQTVWIGGVGSLTGHALCEALNHETLFGYNLTSPEGGPIIEVDFVRTPIVMSGAYGSVNGNVIASGLQGTKGWVLIQGLNKFRVMTVTPLRTLANTTSSLTDISPVAGEIIRISDPGAGLANVVLDSTVSAAGISLPNKTGSDIIEIGRYGSGVNEKYFGSRYTT